MESQKSESSMKSEGSGIVLGGGEFVTLGKSEINFLDLKIAMEYLES